MKNGTAGTDRTVTTSLDTSLDTSVLHLNTDLELLIQYQDHQSQQHQERYQNSNLKHWSFAKPGIGACMHHWKSKSHLEESPKHFVHSIFFTTHIC